tara:strand:+ start:5765 stop:6478 length:714 start_codon:yes stop_codon:yes gene_type:complete
MTKDIRPRINAQQKRALDYLRTKERRILVIGDLHEPFCLSGYREHCIDTYERYNCNQVIFIGDLVDNAFASFHETQAELPAGQDELDFAIAKIQQWYESFSEATCIIGNHDRIIARKLVRAGVPQKWLKSYNEVLGTPNWNWVERIEFDGVQYLHGEGGTATTKVKNDMQSTVQGHIHTQAYVTWFSGQKQLFAMQCGSGVDRESLAMSYAKAFKTQQIACGVVIGGHTAINCLMPL